MSKRMNILIAVALLATVGAVGCGKSKPTAPSGDTVAPAAVVDLRGWVNEGQRPTVGVQWKAGPELDLAGYRIYRSQDSGASTLVATTTRAAFNDEAVRAGSSYVYQVAAFDLADNESPRSSTSELEVSGSIRPNDDHMDD
ncbi:MAG: hypothetical protein ACE5G2_01185 [Candidatus Krumholzibacteriia bacterium]